LASKELFNGFKHSYQVQLVLTSSDVLFALQYCESETTAAVMSKPISVMKYVYAIMNVSYSSKHHYAGFLLLV
jgi:hypothetical protein